MVMRNTARFSRSPLVLLLAALVTVAACSDSSPSAPDSSPLAGLTKAARNDTAPTPPNNTEPLAPGSFHGTIYGYEPGPDTLKNSERLAGVKVTAYPRLRSSTDTLGVGAPTASVLTNSSGEFQLPTMPGGEYVVTFNPPTGSKYRGGWTVATAFAESNAHAWWIMLAVK
jgi:hypothetical protein